MPWPLALASPLAASSFPGTGKAITRSSGNTDSGRSGVPIPTWHAENPGPAGRVAHLVDQAIAIPPPVSTPNEELPGLWNIPGSMLLMHRSGLRRVVPMGARVRKARRGLRRAIREGGVFHLWTHPFNLASDQEVMLATLDAILRDAVRLRDAGRLRIESMGQIADRMAHP